jgi:hypothetical protein
MTKEKFIYRSAKLSGILLMLAAGLHASLGTAEILTAIKTEDIRPTMVATVKNVWLYSSIMLFLSGIWVLFIAKDLRRLQRRAWWQAVFIGLGYTVGSIGAMAWTSVQVHLLAFALIGSLLLLPALLFTGSFRSNPLNPPMD